MKKKEKKIKIKSFLNSKKIIKKILELFLKKKENK